MSTSPWPSPPLLARAALAVLMDFASIRSQPKLEKPETAVAAPVLLFPREMEMHPLTSGCTQDPSRIPPHHFPTSLQSEQTLGRRRGQQRKGGGITESLTLEKTPRIIKTNLPHTFLTPQIQAALCIPPPRMSPQHSQDGKLKIFLNIRNKLLLVQFV